MNHQAIEFLARDRIESYAREAAIQRLARSGELRANSRRVAALRLRGRRMLAFIGGRAGALASSARALVARAG